MNFIKQAESIQQWIVLKNISMNITGQIVETAEARRERNIIRSTKDDRL